MAGRLTHTASVFVTDTSIRSDIHEKAHMGSYVQIKLERGRYDRWSLNAVQTAQ